MLKLKLNNSVRGTHLLFVCFLLVFASKGHTNPKYLVRKVIVLPLIDNHPKAIGKKIQGLTIRHLKQHVPFFKVAPYKVIKNTYKKLGITSGAQLSPKNLNRLTKELRPHMIIMGNVIRLSSINKVLLKIRLARTNIDIATVSFDIPQSSNTYELESAIKRSIPTILEKIPYNGYVDSVIGNQISVQLINPKKPNIGDIIRLIDIRSITKNPVLSKIDSIDKREVATALVNSVRGDIIEATIQKKQPNERIQKKILVDFKPSALFKPQDNAPVTPSIENNTPPDYAPLDLEEDDKIEDPFLSEIEDEPTKDSTSFVSIDRSEHKQWHLGMTLFGAFNTYTLRSNGSDLTPGGIPLNPITGTQLNFEFWPLHYLGLKLNYSFSGLIYDVNIENLSVVDNLYIFNHTATLDLVGKWTFTDSPISPSGLLFIGGVFSKTTIDAIYVESGDDSNSIFLNSNQTISPTAGLQFDFPLGHPDFIISFGGTYWIFPFFNETPSNSTGTGASVMAFHGMGKFQWKISDFLSLATTYNFHWQTTTYSGEGNRFNRVVTNASENHLSHKVALGLHFSF